LRLARFPVPYALESFDFAAIPQLNKTRILELAQGHWIEERHNVILVGDIGTGKPQPTQYPYRHDVCAGTDGHRR
jgi:DNA replication protein DnaC